MRPIRLIEIMLIIAVMGLVAIAITPPLLIGLLLFLLAGAVIIAITLAAFIVAARFCAAVIEAFL